MLYKSPRETWKKDKSKYVPTKKHLLDKMRDSHAQMGRELDRLAWDMELRARYSREGFWRVWILKGLLRNSKAMIKLVEEFQGLDK